MESRWAGYVAHVRKRGGTYWVLVEKIEEKRPTGRHILRWEDNIMMDLQEVGCWVVARIELAQDTDRWLGLVATVTKLRFPKMWGIS
jgi:hypothetical protein